MKKNWKIKFKKPKERKHFAPPEQEFKKQKGEGSYDRRKFKNWEDDEDVF